MAPRKLQHATHKHRRRGTRAQHTQRRRAGGGRTKRTAKRAQKKRTAKRAQKKRARKRTRKKRALQCSPFVHLHAPGTASCFLPADIAQLKARWNRWAAANGRPHQLIRSSREDEVRALLEKHNGDACADEKCWLSQPFARAAEGGAENPNEPKDPKPAKDPKSAKSAGQRETEDQGGRPDLSALEARFAPAAPGSWARKPNEWLTNFDIQKVMRQYEDAYPCFKFIGPTPIDFDAPSARTGRCVWPELCDFQLRTYADQRKHKIGIVFNTDVDAGPGEHWISMFVNTRAAQIVFFDSTGVPPPPEVRALAERIQRQSAELHGRPFAFVSLDGVEHQKKNSECGVYALYFLTHMLRDQTSVAQLRSDLLDDAYMSTFRQIFFNMSR